MTDSQEIQKEQRLIQQIYAAFVAGVVLNFVPSAKLQFFGFVLVLAVLITAYVYRARATDSSLLENHMIYLIHTIWIGSLLLAIGMAVAGLWIYQSGNHSVIQNIINDVYAGVTFTEEQLEVLFMDYVRDNMPLLIEVIGFCIGPGIIYLIYRTAHAVSRATKGYRIAKPHGWF